LDDDIHFRRMERATLNVLSAQSVALQLEALQSGHQVRPRQACAHQRPQHHVAADSRETIEM
jgi:hypothetical protein